MNNGFNLIESPLTPLITVYTLAKPTNVEIVSSVGCMKLNGPPTHQTYRPPDFYIWGYMKENVHEIASLA